MTEVYLIRHGSTKFNNDTDTSQDRIRSWRDVPLSEDGRKEAETTAKALRNKGIKHIYSSDLERAKETADCLGRYCKLPVKTTKELRPWDLGEFTGKSTKESMPKIHKYVDEPDKEVPKGESFNSFRDRAFGGIEKILRDHPKDTVAIVTHHRVERLIKAWMDKGQPKNYDINFNIFKEKGEKPGGHEKLNLEYKKKGGALRNTIKDSMKEVKNGRSS